MDYFQLSLSSTDNTFSAGQTVEGVIRVGLSQPMAVNAIVVRLTGRIITSFEKRENIVSDKYKTERYAAEQECVNLSVNVLDAKPGNKILIPQQEFPFSFQLPADLPPSFKGEHGSVTYTCKAVLHRTEWHKANSVTEKDITIVPAFVASATDLIPLKEDFDNEVGDISDELSWLWCVRGRIFATAMLRASSFSVGELVPISLDIRNTSSRPIKSLELTLLERSSFVGSKANVRLCTNKDCCGCYRSGHTRTEVHEKVLVRLVEELVVEPYASTSLLRTLPLPPSVVPSFDNCPIVQNRHFIKISLVPDTWFGSNMTTELRINICSQSVKRLSSTTHQSGQNGVREPSAPLGTECFASEKSLYPNDLLW